MEWELGTGVLVSEHQRQCPLVTRREAWHQSNLKDTKQQEKFILQPRTPKVGLNIPIWTKMVSANTNCPRKQSDTDGCLSILRGYLNFSCILDLAFCSKHKIDVCHFPVTQHVTSCQSLLAWFWAVMSVRVPRWYQGPWSGDGLQGRQAVPCTTESAAQSGRDYR